MGSTRIAPPLLALITLALACTPIVARGQSGREAKTHQIRVEYVVPKDRRFTALHERVKLSRLLEKFQIFLSPLRLPEPLLLRLQDCDGELNAWYENRVVTVCYEYLDEVARNALRRKMPRGMTYQHAVIGPAIEVFLHEIGHALFQMLDIPVLGSPEVAADHFAAYILLNIGTIATKEDARQTVAGIALMYLRDAQEERREAKRLSKGMRAYAGEHGLAAQRFYNLVCMAYGAYPEVFQMAVETGRLPKERAKRCSGEYRQVAHAMKIHFGPHLDPILLLGLKEARWFDPAPASR